MEEGKISRIKQYVPDDDKDYTLNSIRIEDAENGVVIKCGYKLTEAARDKVKKSNGDTYKYDGFGSDDETHVFESKAAALAFVTSELTELWS